MTPIYYLIFVKTTSYLVDWEGFRKIGRYFAVQRVEIVAWRSHAVLLQDVFVAQNDVF